MTGRSSGPELTVISWRDIPAQVTARHGREIAKRELSPRFQVNIDRAAMEAGLFGSDDYLAEWRRVSRPCGPDLEDEVSREVGRLEADYTPERLNQLAGNGGFADVT
ncbi:MAG: virulence factor [Actinobacteria bacterium]|nr:virulence factor [Actinomycetota bacterium]